MSDSTKETVRVGTSMPRILTRCDAVPPGALSKTSSHAGGASSVPSTLSSSTTALFAFGLLAGIAVDSSSQRIPPT